MTDASDPGLRRTTILVEAAQGADASALNDLFARYLPRTRRIVALRMGWKLQQIQDHKDAVQNALNKVFQGLERFEARTEGAFRNSLAYCVECSLRDTLRQANRKKRGEGNVLRFNGWKPSLRR